MRSRFVFAGGSHFQHPMSQINISMRFGGNLKQNERITDIEHFSTPINTMKIKKKINKQQNNKTRQGKKKKTIQTN